MSDPKHITPEDEERYTSNTTARQAQDEHRIFIKKKKRQKKLIISAGTVFAVTVFLALVICFFAFNIRSVTVEGNEMYTADEITSGAGISPLSNFLFVTEKSIRSNLAKNYPAVSEVTVEKTFPSSVKITVREREPFFYLTLGGFTYILDDKLVVHRTATGLEEAEAMNLRQLYLSDVTECIAGKTIETADEDITEMFATLYEQLKLNELIGEVTSVDFSNKFDIRFTLGAKYTIKIGTILECENKISYVKRFLPQIQNLDIHTVDITDEDVQKIIISKR